MPSGHNERAVHTGASRDRTQFSVEDERADCVLSCNRRFAQLRSKQHEFSSSSMSVLQKGIVAGWGWLQPSERRDWSM